jgi:hypothetical protein
MKALVSAAILLLAVLTPALAADSPLVGVWQLDEAQSGMAGFYIFTPTHYSMMAAAKDRADIVDTNKATADELRAMWNPMLANTGTWEISGDLLTIHPLAAKFPVVMKSGANEVYRFRIEGKTLTLQQVRNARGIEVQSAVVRKFVRVE